MCLRRGVQLTRRNFMIAVGGLVGFFVLLQLIGLPALAQQANPPVRQEPPWDSTQTHDLARRACFDCHSNETQWPWYSNVAPVSWLINRHVLEGREHMNFSEWATYSEDAAEIQEVMVSGEMPLPMYLPLHPEAALSPAEMDQLVEGMYLMLGDDGLDEDDSYE